MLDAEETMHDCWRLAVVDDGYVLLLGLFSVTKEVVRVNKLLLQ